MTLLSDVLALRIIYLHFNIDINIILEYLNITNLNLQDVMLVRTRSTSTDVSVSSFVCSHN